MIDLKKQSVLYVDANDKLSKIMFDCFLLSDKRFRKRYELGQEIMQGLSKLMLEVSEHVAITKTIIENNSSPAIKITGCELRRHLINCNTFKS